MFPVSMGNVISAEPEAGKSLPIYTDKINRMKREWLWHRKYSMSKPFYNFFIIIFELMC